jgi:hypothetical protein
VSEVAEPWEEAAGTCEASALVPALNSYETKIFLPPQTYVTSK